MWIRSQNKQALVNVDKIYINTDKYGPGGADVIGNGVLLGNYDNLSDAIAVLNGIQSIISSEQDEDDVYYMPPDPARELKKHKQTLGIIEEKRRKT